jgi:energy-coupling factor transporter ATP-binding protein EcfA2
MIKSFELTGFRCFASVALEGLTRVNIITGANASGKSALLEALLIAARGTPETLVLLDNMRGLQIGVPALANPFLAFTGNPVVHTAAFKGVWDHFFRTVNLENKGTFKLSTSPRITMAYSESGDGPKCLNIFFQEQTAAEITLLPSTPQLGLPQSITPLVFERTLPNRSTIIQTVTVGAQGQLQVQPRLTNYGPAILIFPATATYSDADNMAWFSQLREAGHSGAILRPIRENFPYIDNLEILSPSGIQSLYAVMKSGEIRRLSTVSAGLAKMVSVFLGCASITNGIILIDEIENGIFYEKYEFLWSALYELAKDSNNQLFIASHSAECLNKILPVMGKDVADFCLLRTEQENGACIVRHVSGSAMRAALRRDDDIRGGTADGGAESENHR